MKLVEEEEERMKENGAEEEEMNIFEDVGGLALVPDRDQGTKGPTDFYIQSFPTVLLDLIN